MRSEANTKSTPADSASGDAAAMRDRIVAAMEPGVVVCDARQPDFPIVYVSDGFTRMSGYTASEAIGRNCRFLQGPKTDPRAVARIREALEKGQSLRLTLWNYRKDGSAFLNYLSLSPARDALGQVTSYVGIQQDVTGHSESVALMAPSDTQLQLGVRLAGFGLSEIDYATGVHRLSAEAAKLFGLGETAVDVSRARVHATFHPDDAPEVNRHIQTSLDAQGPGWFELEHRVIHPDGAVRWLNVRKQVTFGDVDGVRQPVTALLAAIDVTERKLADLELRESRRQLRLALEASDTGLWTWDLQTDKVEWSPECYRIHGIAEGEFGGTGSAFFSLVHPDDRDRVVVSVNQAAERNELYECEFRILRPDGTTAWVANRGRANYDASGRPVGFLGTIIDITQRHAHQDAIRDAQTRFKIMADGMPVPVWVHDASGALVMVNRAYCEYFGVTEAQVMGHSFYPMVHPADATEYVKTFLDALRDRRPWQHRCRVRRADDDDWRWLESSSRPHFSTSGEFLGVVGCSPDVTNHVLAEQALRNADRNKDQFIATLAHELRNPLAAIRGAVDVVKQLTKRPGADIRSLTDVLDRQSRQLTRLVDDLMDVSRISTGKIHLRRSRVEVKDILNHAAESVQRGCESKCVTLRVSTSSTGAPLCVYGDADRLVQVVGNLLNNACKFTNAGDEIEVSAMREGSDAVIRVRDTGIGIPSNQLGRIFDLFAQIDSPDGRQRAGLGIGLSLVKSLVEMHGGRVKVHSDGPGTGSTFTVRLPALDEPAAAYQSVTSGADGVPGVAGKRILVADDNRDTAEVMASLLMLNGHEVYIAHNGQEAIEKAEQVRPEFALLDLGMPIVDGYEAARRIRERLGENRPFMVALTGWGEASDRERSRNAGFDAHLVKPADLDAIESVLNERQNREGHR